MIAPISLAEIGMVSSVKITNFRGFENLKVDDLALINMIVGDNAVGKTAFLEAIFLALSGNADKPLHLKQWRGGTAGFQTGVPDSVVEGIYGDLFNDAKSAEAISIILTGRGYENRKLKISKSRGDVIVPLSRQQRRAQARTKLPQLQQSAVSIPISLTWIDHLGVERSAIVLFGPNGLTFQGTGEQLPNAFMYAAQINIPSDEAAMHYSTLRRRREVQKFREAFFSIFEEITDISVETESGSSVLLVDVPWAKQLLPLGTYSGGTN